MRNNNGGNGHKIARHSKAFEVVIEYEREARTPYKYWVWVPKLPGCYSDGRTREEALENAKEAIELYLEAQENIPKRHKDIAIVKV